MKKRAYLVPMVALTAFSTTAMAKVGIDIPTTSDKPLDAVNDSTLTKAFKDAVQQSIVVYPKDGNLFSYSMDQQSDGTLLAQHRSHMSHASHSSHSSHSSHTSSRF